MMSFHRLCWSPEDFAMLYLCKFASVATERKIGSYLQMLWVFSVVCAQKKEKKKQKNIYTHTIVFNETQVRSAREIYFNYKTPDRNRQRLLRRKALAGYNLKTFSYVLIYRLQNSLLASGIAIAL